MREARRGWARALMKAFMAGALAERRAALTWGRMAMAMGAAMMEFMMVEGKKKK